MFITSLEGADTKCIDKPVKAVSKINAKRIATL